MKRIYSLLLLISILFFQSYIAQAQRKPKYELNRFANQTSIIEEIPETVKKEIYRIDFLLPIYADSLPETQEVIKNIPGIAQTGVNFYEGILMAIDSLEQSGEMYYDIYVHDIGSISVQEWIDKGVLDSTDVIVGALYAVDIPIVAEFAKERKINFVSILSPSDGNITDNPFFIINQPPLEVHLKRMVEYVEFNKSYLNSIFISGASKTDETPKLYIKEHVQRILPNFTLNSYEDINFEKLTNLLVKRQKNIIYTSALDPQDAVKLLKALSTIDKDYQIEVIGYPTWKGLPVLTDGTLPNHITVYVSYPYRFDEEVDLRLKFRNKYNKSFNRGLPTEIVYRGYEVTLWIADLLNQYGMYFNHHMESHPAFCTEYKMELKKENDKEFYFENTQLYFYKYNDNTLKIVE